MRGVAEAAAAAERANAELIRRMGLWQARAAWSDDDSLSAAAWLTANAPMTRATAVRMCATARLVHENEQTATALGAAMCRSRTWRSSPRRCAAVSSCIPNTRTRCSGAAGTLSPDDLVTVARRWRSLADDELAALDAAASHERRYLHVSPTSGGGRIDGFLDSTATATLIAALDSLQPLDPADALEPRSLSVRRADALVLLAERSADPDGGEEPRSTINMLIDVDTLLGRVGTDPCRARCDLTGFGPVGRAVAERLACDAHVARIVMAGKSRVLDLGRATRVVSPALRTAVMARDEHCRHGRCRVPAKWCDVHHIVPWLDGGRTDEANLVLLCRRHHVDTHEGGWVLIRHPDGTLTARRRGRRRRRRGQARVE